MNESEIIIDEWFDTDNNVYKKTYSTTNITFISNLNFKEIEGKVYIFGDSGPVDLNSVKFIENNNKETRYVGSYDCIILKSVIKTKINKEIYGDNIINETENFYVIKQLERSNERT